VTRLRLGRSAVRTWSVAWIFAALAVACGGSRRAGPVQVARAHFLPSSRSAPAVVTAAAKVAQAPSTPAEDPPGAAGVTPLEGDLAGGEPRPSAVKAVRFDVDMLPVATWGRASPRSGYSITGTASRYRVVIRGPWFAEIVIRQPVSSFDIFTGGTFGAGDPPRCGPRPLGAPKYPTYWSGISARGWTDAALNVELGRGEFDVGTCVGVPVASLSARAAAIVPGFVYGLRVLIPPTPIDPGQEQLIVFLPRGALVSAGGDPHAPLQTANTGSFTRLTLPTDPGTSGSASVRLSPAALGLWTALRKTGRPVWAFQDAFKTDNDLLLGVDVVSEGERGKAGARTGSVFVSLPKNAYPLAYERLLSAVSSAAN
jgi:hypothetical protein